MSAHELLDALAPLLRVRPVLDEFCRFGGAWASPRPPSGTGWAQFHIVTRGACHIERPGSGVIDLNAGDILLLPHGDRHVVSSRAAGRAGSVMTTFHNAIRSKSTIGGDPDTELVCGRLLFESTEDNPLIAALPDVIVLRTRDLPNLNRFRTLLTDIRDELDEERPGSASIASDFASALFVMMLRSYLQEAPTEHNTLSLLKDRTAAKVVLALLREPNAEWTLDKMAAVGNTSRATLVRVFHKNCGVAPMAFLSDLRLDLARQRLLGTADSIGKIAGDVGYQSEAALSRAILRRFGSRPGAIRMVDTPGGIS